MDPATQSQDTFAALRTQYLDCVKTLKDSDASNKKITKTYNKIKNIIKACPSKEDQERLLNGPLDENERCLMHIIAELSTQIPYELSKKKSLSLNNLHQFFDFLLKNNTLVNIQDTCGNTPLLYAFAEKEDGTIDWCPEIVVLLLHYQAHPLTQNKEGINPYKHLKKILQERHTHTYTPKNAVTEMHISLIEQALYHYK